MKIKEIKIKRLKRFTDLVIKDIPESARLVVLVGPNGSGKTSIFEAFNHYYRLAGYRSVGQQIYFEKKDSESLPGNWYSNSVSLVFHNIENPTEKQLKGKFYFRTAYRNEADFSINQLKHQKNPTESVKLETLMVNDCTVSENYQRLISKTIAGIYSNSDEIKTVNELKNELIGKIQSSLSRVFNDLNLSSIGDPLSNGSFFFEKGVVKDFHYKNLSAGEKCVFDLILDLIIKSSYYEDAIFCIDEPEAHMHTGLQSKVLKELFNLTPLNSQLWISTHSIGMLKQAEELEEQNPGSVVFLDFDNRDFDSAEVMRPARIDKAIWDKFFDLAFADFSKLIAPATVVFCEGSSLGRKYKDFDAQIYSQIFENKHHDTKFVSVGSCSEIEDIENKSMKMVANILKSSSIIKFVDKDDKSPQEVNELLEKGVKTSSLRHIESYLFDDEIIECLCNSIGKPGLLTTCTDAKSNAIKASVNRGNPPDDTKSASGDIFKQIKTILGLTQCGNNKCAFLRDTMAPLITEDTAIYKKLEKEIFG